MSTRADRRRARIAIGALREMEAEVRRMAKRLPKGTRARSRLEAAARFAEASERSAAADRRATPRLAAARAEHAAARLDRASIRFGGTPRRAVGRTRERVQPGADAAVRAKQRAALVARRRTQAEQVRKMATRAAALTLGQAIVVPKRGDASQRE